MWQYWYQGIWLWSVIKQQHLFVKMCHFANQPLLQTHHVQSHPPCKLERSQNSSYKLTDDEIYCWLWSISLSSVAWRDTQRRVSKGFTAYWAKLARWRRYLIIAWSLSAVELCSDYSNYSSILAPNFHRRLQPQMLLIRGRPCSPSAEASALQFILWGGID